MGFFGSLSEMISPVYWRKLLGGFLIFLLLQHSTIPRTTFFLLDDF
jgi:hypothetical protein